MTISFQVLGIPKLKKVGVSKMCEGARRVVVAHGLQGHPVSSGCDYFIDRVNLSVVYVVALLSGLACQQWMWHIIARVIIIELVWMDVEHI